MEMDYGGGGDVDFGCDFCFVVGYFGDFFFDKFVVFYLDGVWVV